jgi:hypothetical protein
MKDTTRTVLATAVEMAITFTGVMVMSYLGWWAGGKIEKLAFKAAGKITAKKVSEEIIDDFKTKIGKD